MILRGRCLLIFLLDVFVSKYRKLDRFEFSFRPKGYFIFLTFLRKRFFYWPGTSIVDTWYLWYL